MSQTTASLNELIEVLNDGIKFYDDAAQSTRAEAYRPLFQRMASTKRAIVADLKAEVAYLGAEPVEGGTMSGSLRQVYADLRARFSDQPEAQYIAQLEETEDKILHTFEDALTNSSRLEVRRIAQQYLPDVRRMHDEMRELKQRLKSAA